MEKKDTVLEKETKKAHLEAEKRNKDLKQQIRAIRADQEHDRKELKTRLDAVRTDSDKDQEVIKDYVKKVCRSISLCDSDIFQYALSRPSRCITINFHILSVYVCVLVK